MPSVGCTRDSPAAGDRNLPGGPLPIKLSISQQRYNDKVIGEGIFTVRSAYLEADNVCVGFADLVHDPVRAIPEVQVAMLHILEHEILRVAVCEDVVRQDFHLEGAPRRHRLTYTQKLVQEAYF